MRIPGTTKQKYIKRYWSFGFGKILRDVLRRKKKMRLIDLRITRKSGEYWESFTFLCQVGTWYITWKKYRKEDRAQWFCNKICLLKSSTVHRRKAGKKAGQTLFCYLWSWKLTVLSWWICQAKFVINSFGFFLGSIK